jgi:hypothetical protein
MILSMNVVGTGFDRLTCITDMVETPDGNYLMVDPPDDFMDAVKDDAPLDLQFNFNGPDRLEYIFRSYGGELGPHGIKIPFPKSVQRLQRRQNFRVNTLPGTQMQFRMKKIRGVLDLINISLGGVYGILAKHNFKFMRRSILKMNQQVYQCSIVFPGDEDGPSETVYIDQAEVKRVEHDKERDLYRYALAFGDIEKEEHQRLTQAIYDLQRRYLRRRT